LVKEQKNGTSTPKPDIFAFASYRDWLGAFLSYKQQNHTSLRELAKRCKLNSPGYFQQHLKDKSLMTMPVARKIASGFKLNDWERRYFFALLEKEHSANPEEKQNAIKELKRLKSLHGIKKLDDPEFYSGWLNPVIRQILLFQNFHFSIENIFLRLRRITTKAEIQSALDFLKKKKLIREISPGNYETIKEEFIVKNDTRNIDIKRSHQRFLEIAKHRLEDDSQDREFQGLTVAIRAEQLPDLKNEIRKFMDRIDADLSNTENPNTVVHLQICAFNLTEKPKS